MNKWYTQLQDQIQGDIEYSDDIRTKYSHDASLLEVMPEVVIFPKDSKDIQTIVSFVNTYNRDAEKKLSITPRSAGTCMSGGSIGESIILDMTRYMNKIFQITKDFARVMPGVYYRDFEKETLQHHAIMPSFTASKNLCAVGGMFGNNAGGEKTIKYGKVENYILETKTVFADGHEYLVKPLTETELQEKIAQKDFEGAVYKSVYEMIQKNYEAITHARPKVSKNSAGYYLWNVWDKEKKIFDLNKLLVGSQGTLGITTEITFRLVPVEPVANLLAIFLPDISRLGDLVDTILPFEPDSLESFDEYSMKLALKFFPDFIGQMGFFQAARLGLQFIPEAFMMLRGGLPKLILLVEVTGTSESQVSEKLLRIQEAVHPFGYASRIARSSREAEKYWKIRHESFNLLRKHVKGKRTAPFIDDVVVHPKHLPTFLPRLQKILDREKLIYTIAGHAGNGNFHIIPLMDMRDPKNIQLIDTLSDEVYDLVLEYGGSITAEHNDGIIRTPYLEKMYGPFIFTLFKQTKKIFDRDGIFNPGKKVGGTKEYMLDHIRIEK
jgi:FAD/FMN-containing dehydrogenase